MKRVILSIAVMACLAIGTAAQDTAQQCAKAWRNAGTDTCARRQVLETWTRISPDDADLALAKCEYYRTLAARGNVTRSNEALPIDTTDFKLLAIDSVAQKTVVTTNSYDPHIMEKAVAALRHGIAANPGNSTLRTAMIVALADAGHFNESATEALSAIKRESHNGHGSAALAGAVAYAASAMVNASEVNAPLVISTTKAALALYPHNTTLLYYLESTLMLTEAYAEAMKVQQQLLSITPGNCQVMSDAAMACLATGQREKAIEYCRKVMAQGNSEQRQLAREMLNMINCSTF